MPAARRIARNASQATVAELLAQDAVLLLDVLDDLALAAVHPAGEHQQQELKRRGRHTRPSYARSVQDRPASCASGEPQALMLPAWIQSIMFWHQTRSRRG